MSEQRGTRKTAIGVVKSAKMNKTRRVEVERLVKHEEYSKFVRRRTICHAHDEKNETGVGDTVEMMETRPMSKLKRWRIVRVIAKGEVPVAAEGMPEAGA